MRFLVLVLLLGVAPAAFALPPVVAFPQARRYLPFVLGKKEPYKAKPISEPEWSGGKSHCESLRRQCVLMENQVADTHNKMAVVKSVSERDRLHRKIERRQKQMQGCYQRHRRCQGTGGAADE
ncbi:MAG: hypothetical protein HYS22_05925 [Deltaproteobacteria bacterium]|nr:hypothetical protein [Deltaproteobacteria bacterium]